MRSKKNHDNTVELNYNIISIDDVMKYFARG